MELLHNIPKARIDAVVNLLVLLYPYFRMTFEAQAANWIKAETEGGGGHHITPSSCHHPTMHTELH